MSSISRNKQTRVLQGTGIVLAVIAVVLIIVGIVALFTCSGLVAVLVGGLIHVGTVLLLEMYAMRKGRDPAFVLACYAMGLFSIIMGLVFVSAALSVDLWTIPRPILNFWGSAVLYFTVFALAAVGLAEEQERKQTCCAS